MNSTSDRRAALIATDSVVGVAAVFLGVLLRYGVGYRTPWEGTLGLPPVWLLATCFGILTFASFAVAGTYRRQAYWSFRTELGDLTRGLMLLGVVTLSLLYLFKLEDVSRLSLVIAFAVQATLSGVMRIALRHYPGGDSGSTHATRWVLVGSGESAHEFLGTIGRDPRLAASMVGLVGDDFVEAKTTTWLGPVGDLPQILAREVVDEVVVVLDTGDWAKLEGVISVCAEQGKTVRMPIGSISPSLLKGRLELFDRTPMWSVLATPEHRLALSMKRLFDVAASAALIVLCAPVVGAAALAVMAVDGRPVLFRQWRGGLHGRPFRMVKLRTMVVGADEMRADLAAANERVGPVFKLADDPRVTPLGRWLRRTSIDELPQLWNVLVGEMSLVGPRPQPLEEVAAYDLWHRRRLSMRPGITGLWQVSAREDPSFKTWMDLDLRYIDGWSMWMDALILLKTPGALLRSPGT